MLSALFSWRMIGGRVDEDRVLIEPRKIPGDPEIDSPMILVLFEPYVETLRKECLQGVG